MFHILIPAILMQAVPGSSDLKVIYSDIPALRAEQERTGWADAVITGDTIYLSGVIAAKKPGETDLGPAYERAFDRLSQTLKRSGSNWANVVEIRSYHTDVVAQIDAMAAVLKRYRTKPHPAWTAVGTNGLLNPHGITEIALVAKLMKEEP